MDSSSFPPPHVALVAAYAVALQTLLAAFVPVALAVAADSFAVLCTHDADGPGQPAQHDPPCAAICAAMGHGIAGAVPPGMAVNVAVQSADRGAAIPASDWVPPQIALPTATRRAGRRSPDLRQVRAFSRARICSGRAARAQRTSIFGALP